MNIFLTIKKLIKMPLRLVGLRITDNNPHLASLLKVILLRYRYLVILIIVLNTSAAVFEGSTMGILLAALKVLMGELSTESAASLGMFQKYADTLLEYFKPTGLFAFLIGLAVLSQLSRSGFQFFGKTATAFLQARGEYDLRSGVFRQFMAMSYAQVARYKIGDMVSYTYQTNTMVSYLGYLNLLVSDVLILGSYVGVLLFLSWRITLLAVVTLFLLSLVMNRVTHFVQRAATAFVKASVRLNEQTIEYLHGIRTVRMFAREKAVIDVVDKTLSKSMLANRKGLIWEASILPLVECFTVICLAGLLIVCYLFLDTSDQTWLPRMAVYVFIVYRLMPRAGSINTCLASLRKLHPAVSRVAEVLRTDNKEYIDNGDKMIDCLSDSIEFKNVTFSYGNKDSPILRNVSVTLPKGTMTAIVGESGAGKSTILDLVLRFYDPEEGSVLVDGVSLPKYDQEAWRDCIGVVNQDVHIFNASLRDNIAFRKPEATDREIENAARIANAEDFIQALPEGYQTVVGERGLRLSGGQRQRIAIARAVLHDSPVLIFDEATSELDSKSEQRIQESLAQLRVDRTVIAVAHRLSTVIKADQILVLHEGQVVERGTHRELIDRDERYAHLWRVQSRSVDSHEEGAI